MGRYRWYGDDREAYDEGHREQACWRNPYERYGSHEEEQKHEAYAEGCGDARREEEEEAREEEERESSYRRQQEEAEVEAQREEEQYQQQQEEEPGE